MKLYYLTHDQLIRLVYLADIMHTNATRTEIVDLFLEEVAPPTRELSPAMEAQYEHAN